MRKAFGTKYGISLPLAPDYWYLRHFDAKAMESSVDFFGFMAYGEFAFLIHFLRPGLQNYPLFLGSWLTTSTQRSPRRLGLKRKDTSPNRPRPSRHSRYRKQHPPPLVRRARSLQD
jgi:hypothetical protein